MTKIMYNYENRFKIDMISTKNKEFYYKKYLSEKYSYFVLYYIIKIYI